MAGLPDKRLISFLLLLISRLTFGAPRPVVLEALPDEGEVATFEVNMTAWQARLLSSGEAPHRAASGTGCDNGQGPGPLHVVVAGTSFDLYGARTAPHVDLAPLPANHEYAMAFCAASGDAAAVAIFTIQHAPGGGGRWGTQAMLFGFSLSSGARLWVRELDLSVHRWGRLAAGHLLVGLSHEVALIDLKTGRDVWPPLEVGAYPEAPTPHDRLVVIGAGNGHVVVDLGRGEVLWAVARNPDSMWQVPIVVGQFEVSATLRADWPPADEVLTKTPAAIPRPLEKPNSVDLKRPEEAMFLIVRDARTGRLVVKAPLFRVLHPHGWGPSSVEFAPKADGRLRVTVENNDIQY